MLTNEHQILANKLANKVGELRPGFLDKDAAEVIGPHINNSAARKIEDTNKQGQILNRKIKRNKKTGLFELYLEK